MRVIDELEKIESIIGLIHEPQITPEKVAMLKQQAKEETDHIKKAFIKKTFGLFKEKKIERYIQFHQSALVHLTDTLINELSISEIEEIHSVSSENTRINLIKFLYLQLEDLLTYIEKYFAKYFNQSGKTPESYRFIVHRELKQKLPHVRYGLEKKGINKRLLSIILYPLDNFVESVRTQEVSYRRIIYLRQLLEELQEQANNGLTSKRLDFKICLTLGYLNFNSHRFFKYCVHEITSLVQDQETLSLQIEKLSFTLKTVNQVQAKPGFVFNEKLSGIKEQLSVWIGEEIYFFEKRQQLSLNFPAHAEDPVQKNFKLQLNMSVAQLACLLRGLKDIGIIKNNNVLEVIRFMAGVVQSKNTENISWESLRAKFYNVELSAKEGVKDIAMNLFNHIRKLP